MDVLFATSNEHKVGEVRAILAPLGITVRSLGDVPGAPEEPIAAEPREQRARPEPAPSRHERPVVKKKGTISEHRRDERERIIEALRACNWNRVKAAELSGIPRRTFYRRLREYGIQ